MADWWLYVKSPSIQYQRYPLGDYQANGPNWTNHQTAVGTAINGLPPDWYDQTDGFYDVSTIDMIYTRGPAANAVAHDGPPDPDFPFDADA